MIASLLASVLIALVPASARTDDIQLAAQHLRDDHPNLFHDLSPARFEHINPYGKYFFPIEQARNRQGLRSLRAA